MSPYLKGSYSVLKSVNAEARILYCQNPLEKVNGYSNVSKDTMVSMKNGETIIDDQGHSITHLKSLLVYLTNQSEKRQPQKGS